MIAASHDQQEHVAALPRVAAIELGRRWADAFNRRDGDALVDLADPGIAFYPTRLLGGHRHYMGHDGLRRWIADIAAMSSPLSELVTDVRHGRPGNLVALGGVFAHGATVGPFCVLISLRAGKVTEARAYLSDEAELQRIGRIPA